MSIKLLDSPAFYGFRVRRTINGHLYQEYFSLSDPKLRGGRVPVNTTYYRIVKGQAVERDKYLTALRETKKRENIEKRCFNNKGDIKGIQKVVKTQRPTKKAKDRNPLPTYQVGIQSDLTGKMLNTSVSINAYGEEKAWRYAVQAYCKHRKITRKSDLYAKLLDSRKLVDDKFKRKLSG